MSASPLLAAGAADLTPYLINGGLRVSEEPVYEDGGFTNMLGQTIKKQTAISVKISASLKTVPEEDAAAIAAALDPGAGGTLAITYSAPITRSGSFDRPVVDVSLAFSDGGNDEILYYDIDFSTGGIIPLDGL